MFENLTGGHRPDILDCISNLSSDEVFTPPRIANEMLDLLPAAVWTNPRLRFLDPGCKSGVFLREAARRLMEGLKKDFPVEAERRDHIFKEMLFGFAITELTGFMSRRSLYYSKDASSKNSVTLFPGQPQGNIPFNRRPHSFKGGKCESCGASESKQDRGESHENYAYQFIHPEAGDFEMKFDVIIGNPPYHQEDAGDATSSSNIYHLFVEQAKKLRPRYISMIIPSRWFAGGKGMNGFRQEMLEDTRISHIVDFPEASDCFPGIKLRGGVGYFLWDRDHSGECLVTQMINGKCLPGKKRKLDQFLATANVFIRSNEAVSIIEKVRAKNEPTLDKRVSAAKPFGFRTDFTDFKAKEFEGAVEVYAKDKKTTGWVRRSQITQNLDMVDKHKVLVLKAYGEEGYGPFRVAGPVFQIPPNSCCTEKYIVIGAYDAADETKANNLAAYVKTRLFRFLLMQKMITQDNSRDKFIFVPDLDMSQTWTDTILYQRYGITSEEIAFIEKMVREET